MRVYVCTVNCTVFCPEQDTRRLMSVCSECLLTDLQAAWPSQHLMRLVSALLLSDLFGCGSPPFSFTRRLSHSLAVCEKRYSRRHRLGLNGHRTAITFKAHSLLDEKQPSLAISDRVVFPDALNDCLAVRFPVACQGADEGVC
jgi:hypothetical protein